MSSPSSSKTSSSVLVMPTNIVLPADDDQFPLSVTMFSPPPGVEVRAVAVFANATGVQARFYHRFASLATLQRKSGGDEDDYQDRMHTALLAAPRNMGLNDTWARKDLASVIRFGFRSWRKVPLTVMGHSLGGHLMLVCDYETTYHQVDPDGTHRTARLMAINAGNPHPKNLMEGTWDQESDYGFHMAGVLTLETDGVFRASYMGLGYDLPYGAGKEWARWFNHPHFSLNIDADLQRARKITANCQYIYLGFEDDGTISKKMMIQQSTMLNVESGNVQTFWINPKAQKPRFPQCGHVDLFSPSKPVPAALKQPAAGADASNTPESDAASSNSEAYKPLTEEGDEGQESAEAISPLTREQTIWQVLLRYIVEGTVDPKIGEYRRLTAADARDIQKERKMEEEFRRKHGRNADGSRPETGYPDEVGEPKSKL
ncbi:hypothetical protein OC861_005008 [Tilletia horrida]|nr:hypothetical protein OC861_005008 [Tilletia horrida]